MSKKELALLLIAAFLLGAGTVLFIQYCITDNRIEQLESEINGE